MFRHRFLIADALLLALACMGAFLVRLQFMVPWFGWRIALVNTIIVVVLQFVLLTVARLNIAYRWRMFGNEIPRYLGVFLIAAGLMLVLRWFVPSRSLMWIRPPFSVTLIDMVFAFCAIVGFRFLRERYWVDRFKVTLKDGTPEATLVEGASWLKGKVVMITGAGGSIGSEIVRQTVRAGAKTVLMVERGENALYKINLEVEGKAEPLMIDINEVEKLEAVFAKWPVDVVFHAAAYKHVPMCEFNEVEAWRNNTEATRKLVKVAKKHGIKKLVLISTDKAVHPSSVMGKTKREAEKIVLQACYRVVRFGNVFGSSGSVIERWKNQIQKGRPVTITDERMTRFFMSVEEAVGLVIAAGKLEPGFVYVLDMGKPIRIVDLAQKIIRQYGYRPYTDIPIVFTGIRPGEKLEEELGIEHAGVVKTEFKKIWKVQS